MLGCRFTSVRVCMRACVRACVCLHVCMCLCLRVRGYMSVCVRECCLDTYVCPPSSIIHPYLSRCTKSSPYNARLVARESPFVIKLGLREGETAVSTAVTGLASGTRMKVRAAGRGEGWMRGLGEMVRGKVITKE